MLLQQVAQPFIERQVSNTLEQPVEMGRVTRVSFNRIQFGPTRLVARPGEGDTGLAQAVDVRFTPLKIVLQRRLELDITLKDSTAQVEEDKDGTWIKIPEFPEGSLPIKIRVTAIRIQQASVNVIKRDAEDQPKEPIQLEVDRGALLIHDGNKDMEIEQLQGKFLAGGEFEIDGDVAIVGGLDGLKGKLAARVRNINLAEVARILPPLPAEVRQGRVSANTVIRLDGNPIQLENRSPIRGGRPFAGRGGRHAAIGTHRHRGIWQCALAGGGGSTGWLAHPVGGRYSGSDWRQYFSGGYGREPGSGRVGANSDRDPARNL